MNRIISYSLELFQDFCEDLNKELFLKIFIEGAEAACQNHTFIQNDLFFFNLTLKIQEEGLNQLKKALNLVREGGIILANLIGGESYQELVESLALADLEENFFLERIKPRIQASDILDLAKEVGIKNPVLMEDRQVFFYKNFTTLIKESQEANFQLLNSDRKLDWIKVKAHYWENFAQDNQFKLTLNYFTLLLVKS
jgi:hypothetical protein